jgi:hypothetical protein
MEKSDPVEISPEKKFLLTLTERNSETDLFLHRSGKASRLGSHACGRSTERIVANWAWVSIKKFSGQVHEMEDERISGLLDRVFEKTLAP